MTEPLTEGALLAHIEALHKVLDEAEVPGQGRYILVPMWAVQRMRRLFSLRGPRPRFRGARGRKRSINWRRK